MGTNALGLLPIKKIIAAGVTGGLLCHACARPIADEGLAEDEAFPLGQGASDSKKASCKPSNLDQAEKTIARKVVVLINESRKSEGLMLLKVSQELTRKAQAWSEEMIKRGHYVHSTPGQCVTAEWRGIAENVGGGKDAKAIHDGFMKSSSHRKNILYALYTHVGVGVAADSEGFYYATEVFLHE